MIAETVPDTTAHLKKHLAELAASAAKVRDYGGHPRSATRRKGA